MKRSFYLAYFFQSLNILFAQVPEVSWARQFGGISDDQGYSISTDHLGNIYTTGIIKGTASFDTTVLNAVGGMDVFILKTTTEGNVEWVKSIGGPADDIGATIVTDKTGNIYYAGSFNGIADFNPGTLQYESSSNGNKDIFVSKLNSEGGFVWAKTLGSVSNDYPTSIGLDSIGNCYITGIFNGTLDFNPGAGSCFLTSAGASDVFVLKLDSSGNFLWAETFGSINNDAGNSLYADSSGIIYITGSFNGTVDFNPDSFSVENLTSFGYDDIFVLKLNAAGNLIWAKQAGGGFLDIGYSIVADEEANVYITGEYQGTADFDPGNKSYHLNSLEGTHDIFILKLNRQGEFMWAKSVGGNTDNDHGYSIALDNSYNVYITGFFSETADFNPDLPVYELSAIGNYEMFILKLNNDGSFKWAGNMRSTSFNYGASIKVDTKNNIYTTGFFSGTTDFDAGTSDHELTSSGKTDIFILKLHQNGSQVNKSELINNFKIFPNPTSGLCHYSLPKGNSEIRALQIDIYNTIGELISSQTKGEMEGSIDLSEVTEGLYTILFTVVSNEINASFSNKIMVIKNK